ncbi:MAG: hypothetical protein ACP5QN_03315, partial [Minisyncoccia bacterium]
MNRYEKPKFEKTSPPSQEQNGINESQRIIELRDRLIADFTIFQLYEKGMADDDHIVRRFTAQSLGALASV